GRHGAARPDPDERLRADARLHPPRHARPDALGHQPVRRDRDVDDPAREHDVPRRRRVPLPMGAGARLTILAHIATAICAALLVLTASQPIIADTRPERASLQHSLEPPETRPPR